MENTSHNQTSAIIPLAHRPIRPQMHQRATLISFPASECAATDLHSISPGGDTMNVKHEHPIYASEEERKARLLDLKRACVVKLAACNKTPVKTA